MLDDCNLRTLSKLTCGVTETILGQNVNTETTVRGEMRQPYLRYDSIRVDDENDLPHTNRFGIVRPRLETLAAFLVSFLDCQAKGLFLKILVTIIGERGIRD